MNLFIVLFILTVVVGILGIGLLIWLELPSASTPSSRCPQ